MIERNINPPTAGFDVLSSALEFVTDAVFVTDPAGRVLFTNHCARHMTGLKAHEAIGRQLGVVLKLTLDESGQRVEDPIRALIHAGQDPVQKTVFVFTARDGTERRVIDAGSAPRKQNDRLQGFVIIVRDLQTVLDTDSKRFKEEHLESIGNLAGGIAHDFNNVLTAIVGNLSLAKMCREQPEKLWNRLHHAEKAAMRAKDLSRQLLTFAKGGAPIRCATDLKPLVHDSASMAMHETEAQCDFMLDGDLWSVDVDQGQLSLAIRNLVVFCAQSMPAGGRVEVHATNLRVSANSVKGLAPGNYVMVRIRDHGPGIPAQDLPRLFEPYFATRKTGSGLGLATAYSIMERHQGTIRVESILDRGTTFKIYLPASNEIPVNTPAPVEEIPSTGSGRILVMDDEADVRLVANDMLELMGYEVETSPDGGHALQLFQTAKRIGRPFSAVIFDLTIPTGMGGKEAVVKLREIDPTARAIVSSGYSYDPVMANFRDYGFDGVVPKPYKPEELARTLKQVLSRAHEDGIKAY